jgi:enterochelin esterase family protein
MKYLGLWLALLVSVPSGAQTNKAFQKAMRQLRSFASQDSIRVQASVNRWWDARTKGGQVPLLSKDSAVFLYRGTASSVAWAGDFNGWGSKPSPAKGMRIRNTDIWMTAFAFPPAAHFDYKIILNGKDWILDPVNPHQQYSGVGGGSPNSEVRMPGWKMDKCQLERSGIQRGTLASARIQSNILGYEVAYSVYTPAGASNIQGTPILYVTDGNEYADPRLGNMPTVLDNLIADKRIQPVRVVFIDAREPGNLSNNRRMTELSLNEAYLNFITEELIPVVEGAKPADRTSRGIMGTSLGGLMSAFVSFKRPDLFGLTGIQSPAFWYKPEIFALAEKSGDPRLRCFLSAGTVFDAATESRKMKGILEQQGHSCTYVETDEAHSWGNWRNLLEELLVELYSRPGAGY